ncbi:hypothetical protein JTB14_015409 [Gonioctena quinquepunctata]|nr:hypothetical protein JTB14_015409 [Gonioctena quinquepunctata]
MQFSMGEIKMYLSTYPSDLENLEDISKLYLKPKSHSEPGTPISKQKNTIEKPPEEDNSTQLSPTQMNDKADTTLKEATNIQGTPKTGATNKNTKEPPQEKPNTRKTPTEWVTNFLTD